MAMTPELLALAAGLGEALHGQDLQRGAYARVSAGGGVFSSCRLAQVDFREADLRETLFDHCDLTGALLGGAQLRHAVFHRCILDHADLRQAQLQPRALDVEVLTFDAPPVAPDEPAPARSRDCWSPPKE